MTQVRPRMEPRPTMLLLVSLFLVSLSPRLLGAQLTTYADLEALDLNCRERFSCHGKNRPNRTRGCECDIACTTYKDCCVDAPRRGRARGPKARAASARCMQFGEQPTSGVYVVANCSPRWNGSPEVRQKCLGPPDFSDPMTAAPHVSVVQGIAYKNLFCAECNNANMQSLETFQFKLSCGGLPNLTQAQMIDDLEYNPERKSWGINRMNPNGTKNFVDCQIMFDVPDYLKRSVRFCHPNLVSTCVPDWKRPLVKQQCEEYTAVVYEVGGGAAYRNPHCAICNRKTVAQVTCEPDVTARKKPMSFALLLDVNMRDGDQVGMIQVVTPECPARPRSKYDPFFHRCRRLVCALPGFVVDQDTAKCVKKGR